MKIPRLISSLGQEFWQPGFGFVLALSPSQNPATAIDDIGSQTPRQTVYRYVNQNERRTRDSTPSAERRFEGSEWIFERDHWGASHGEVEFGSCLQRLVGLLFEKYRRMNLLRVVSGELQSVDGYMNIALEDTKEYVDGKLRRNYGDAFVRGNNGEFHVLILCERVK